MQKIFKYYIFILILSPIIAYFWENNFDIAYYNFMTFLAQLIFIGFLMESMIVHRRIKVPKYIYPLFSLFIYYYIWGFYNGEVAERGLIMLTFNNYSFQTLALLLLIENVEWDKNFILKLIPIIKLTIISSLIFSIIQTIYSPDFFSSKIWGQLDYISSVRRHSIFSYLDEFDLGISLLSLLAVLISWYYIKKNTITHSIIFTLIVAIVVFLSNSRWTMLNFLFLMLIYVIYSKKTIQGFLKYSIITGMILLIVWNILPLLGYNLDIFIKERLLSESAMTRLYAFENFAYYFPQNPWFGRGSHLTRDIVYLSGSYQIHVGYLAHLDEWGIIGSLFIFSFWIMFARQLFNESKKSRFYGGFFAFSFFLIANLTLVKYHIVFYGLILALVFHRYYVNKEIK